MLVVLTAVTCLNVSVGYGQDISLTYTADAYAYAATDAYGAVGNRTNSASASTVNEVASVTAGAGVGQMDSQPGFPPVWYYFTAETSAETHAELTYTYPGAMFHAGADYLYDSDPFYPGSSTLAHQSSTDLEGSFTVEPSAEYPAGSLIPLRFSGILDEESVGTDNWETSEVFELADAIGPLLTLGRDDPPVALWVVVGDTLTFSLSKQMAVYGHYIDQGHTDWQVNMEVIPEPASALLLLVGVAGLVRRRMRRGMNRKLATARQARHAVAAGVGWFGPSPPQTKIVHACLPG